jgi:hypothetical protein
MKRHPFEPGALVLGLVLLALSAAFLLDATDVWDLSDTRLTIPVAGGGLALAAAVAVVTQIVRSVRRRRARRTS